MFRLAETFLVTAPFGQNFFVKRGSTLAGCDWALKTLYPRQASSPHHQICFGFVSDGETSLATPLERVQNL